MRTQVLLLGCCIGSIVGAWMQGFSTVCIGITIGLAWSFLLVVVSNLFGVLDTPREGS